MDRLVILPGDQRPDTGGGEGSVQQAREGRRQACCGLRRGSSERRTPVMGAPCSCPDPLGQTLPFQGTPTPFKQQEAQDSRENLTPNKVLTVSSCFPGIHRWGRVCPGPISPPVPPEGSAHHGNLTQRTTTATPPQTEPWGRD